MKKSGKLFQLLVLGVTASLTCTLPGDPYDPRAEVRRDIDARARKGYVRILTLGDLVAELGASQKGQPAYGRHSWNSAQYMQIYQRSRQSLIHHQVLSTAMQLISFSQSAL